MIPAQNRAERHRQQPSEQSESDEKLIAAIRRGQFAQKQNLPADGIKPEQERFADH